jgi:hypothetical protein
MIPSSSSADLNFSSSISINLGYLSRATSRVVEATTIKMAKNSTPVNWREKLKCSENPQSKDLGTDESLKLFRDK